MSLDNISTVRDLLQQSWILVEFTKKDGSLRVMRCTTNMDLIPEEARPKQKIEENVSIDEAFEVEKAVDLNPVFKVYEYNKGWRSFRFNQVESYEQFQAIVE